MTVLESMSALVEAAGAWKDAVEQTPAMASQAAMSLLADCLDGPRPADHVPPMWLAATAAWPAAETLGADGHPVAGLGYPPIERRRRMFAGGTVRLRSPVAVEEPLTRRSQVSGVRATSGRSGPLLFVTVSHRYLDSAGATKVEEEHQLVYRSAAESVVPAAAAAREPTAPTTSGPDKSLTLATDPVRLFRFSALTANSHRIHYDAAYARDIEGHQGVVVHGPLIAMLALELPRRYAAGRRVGSFAYRLRHPAGCGSDLHATVVDEQPGHWIVAVRAEDVVTLTGEIHFDADES
jgi:3-methylfumaryl-CoA hydratase